jgi:putative hydrolase of the HAD superfamily
MAITTLIFDLDDTLIDDTRAVETALALTAHAAQRHCGIDPIAFMQTARSIAGELWRASSTIDYARDIGVSSWEGLCTTFLGSDAGSQALKNWAPVYQAQVWGASLRKYGVEDAALAHDLDRIYQQERLTDQHLFPEVEGVLERLSSRYRLGMITNGASDLQRRKIQRAGLARFFSVMTVSEEVGVGKPHPQIFLQTLNELDAEPSNAAMIGDNLSRDIVGARATGLKGIWVNRAGMSAASKEEVMPDEEIDTLLALENMR